MNAGEMRCGKESRGCFISKGNGGGGAGITVMDGLINIGFYHIPGALWLPLPHITYPSLQFLMYGSAMLFNTSLILAWSDAEHFTNSSGCFYVCTFPVFVLFLLSSFLSISFENVKLLLSFFLLIVLRLQLCAVFIWLRWAC